MGRPAQGRPPSLPRSAKCPVERGPVRRAPRRVDNGFSSPVALPVDALIEPQWSPAAARRRPRRPHRRIAPAMHPLIPRAPGRARPARSPGRATQENDAVPLERGAEPLRSFMLVSHACIPGMGDLRSPAPRRATSPRADATGCPTGRRSASGTGAVAGSDGPCAARARRAAARSRRSSETSSGSRSAAGRLARSMAVRIIGTSRTARVSVSPPPPLLGP
jgi:hypothetical protein